MYHRIVTQRILEGVYALTVEFEIYGFSPSHWEELLQSISNLIFRLIIIKFGYFFYLLPSLSDKIIIKYVLILTKYVPWLSFCAEMVDDETGGSIFSPDFMPGYQMENLKSRLPSFLYYIFFPSTKVSFSTSCF